VSEDSEERIGLDVDELPKARDAYQHMADPRLLRRIDHLAKKASAMVRDPDLPIRLQMLPFHLEPSDWRAGYLAVHDVELPPQLYGDLKECAPQALLRDLFRPEREAFVWYDREVQVTLDLGGTKAFREALATQKRDPLPVVKPLVDEVVARAESWRKIVRDRWQPFLDDSQPRKKVYVVHDPTLNW
jgi:hypothetical protein